jgi:hypothetical protein
MLSEFIPRYGLPMWQLLLLSLYIFGGSTADLLAGGGGTRFRASRTCGSMSLRCLKCFAQPSIGSKQSAGRLPKPG